MVMLGGTTFAFPLLHASTRLLARYRLYGFRETTEQQHALIVQHSLGVKMGFSLFRCVIIGVQHSSGSELLVCIRYDEIYYL